MSSEYCKIIINDINNSLHKIDTYSKAVPPCEFANSIRGKEDTASSEHDLEIVTSMLSVFIKDIDKVVALSKTSRTHGEVPLFAMMNNQLFSQKKFRDAITRIMSDYYDCFRLMAAEKRDPRIICAGKLMESLTSHIREASNLLQGDESFSHTIVLIKANNILRLKDLQVSETNIYHDFVVKHDSEQTELNIVNRPAFASKKKEANRIAANQLKELRQIRSDIKTSRICLEEFERSFTNLLYIRREFAAFWRAVLASDEFGYAVDSYYEKCTKELNDFEKRVDSLSRMRSKLQEAEMSLLQAEKAAGKPSRVIFEKISSIGDSVKKAFSMLMTACVRSIGARYKSLIGDPNLKKYRELQSHLPALIKAQKTQGIVSLSRKKSTLGSKQSSADQQGVSKISKVAEILGLDTVKKPYNRELKQAQSQFCVHQDIIDEYDVSMAQTLTMLNQNEAWQNIVCA